MINIRTAQKKDIPFIIKGILEIEKINDNDNTYNQLFGTDTNKTIKYLTQIFEDSENIGTELSLNTFIIAEIDGISAGFCSLIYTDKKYYLNKGEIFLLHLDNTSLKVFSEKTSFLPDTRKYSENKYFIEYIFTNENFRKRGVANKMILYQTEKIPFDSVFINVFKNKPDTIKYYKKLGYTEFIEFEINSNKTSVYPSKYKMILTKRKK